MKKYMIISLAVGLALPLQSFAKSSVSQVHKPAFVKRDVPGFVFIEEDFYGNLQDLPQDFIQASEIAYSQKNFSEAASDLKAASRILQLDSTAATGDGKAELNLAANDLERIAGDITDNNIKTPFEFRARLMSAMYHQAEYHRERATQHWLAKEYKRAGQDMKQSVVAIDKATKWSGQEIETGAQKSMRGVREVSGQLIKGAGWTTAQVGNAFRSLGVATESLADRVMPKDTVSGTTQAPAPTPKRK